jgi:DnaA family protein
MPVQIPLRIRLRDSSVFASYYAARNQAVVDALLAMTTGIAPTCVWLHGAPSTGKTHLLQSMCVRWSERGEASAYLPIRDLGASAQLLFGYGQFALVAIDDGELLAGRADWERALFSLHQELDERGGHLLIAGATAPAALDFKLRDLASRLNGGLVLTLAMLDEDEQMRALQLRAGLRGFELPEDTARYLLRRLPRDMATLCAFLDELDEASLIAQHKLTVPFVKSVLEKNKMTRVGSSGSADP